MINLIIKIFVFAVPAERLYECDDGDDICVCVCVCVGEQETDRGQRARMRE